MEMSSVQLSYNLYRLARSLFRRNLLSTCRGATHRRTLILLVRKSKLIDNKEPVASFSDLSCSSARNNDPLRPNEFCRSETGDLVGSDDLMSEDWVMV